MLKGDIKNSIRNKKGIRSFIGAKAHALRQWIELDSQKQIRWGLFIVFLTSFGLDRLSKCNVDFFLRLKNFGPIYFEIHSNPGFILQTLSNVSPFARVVFVSSLYGFLFFAFFLIQAILSRPFYNLRIGLTLFFSSITANALDRAMNGAVCDFICFNFLNRSIYFNVADIFMWIAATICLYSLYYVESDIWYPNTKRKTYLVNYRYQFKWAFRTALTAFSSSLVLILFSYTYFMHSDTAYHVDGPVFLTSGVLLSSTFSVITFLAGVLFSHRSAGALQAFEKYVDLLIIDPDQKPFTLRQNDEHQNLMKLAEKLRTNLKSVDKRFLKRG